MPTFKDYRQEVARKLGGFRVVSVSLDPDPTDTFAQRQVLSAALYDADKGSKGMANQFCWVGKYRDQRRFRENGYRSLAYSVFRPPESGTYTLTFYGYGTTAPIAAAAPAATIQAAAAAIDPGLGTVAVSGDGNPYVMSLPDVIDTEISSGTMLATGGIGAITVQRSFTRALVTGDMVEIHTKMPVDDDDNIQGLNTLINMALRRMWFIDRFPITPITNSRGVQTFYGLSDVDWLRDKRQVIALYGPALWEMRSTLTPPVSGTFTLQLTVGSATHLTGPIAYDATGQQIQDALTAASGLPVTVSPTTLAASYVVVLPRTYYATPTLTASAGAVVNARTMLEQPRRYPSTWSFEYDGESPFIRSSLGSEGESFYVEAYRPGHSWVCPQASYGVLGDTWQSSDVGLVDDYDQAVPSLETVASVAYALACRQLATVGPASERGTWELDARRAEGAAAVTKLYDLPFNDKPSNGGYYGGVGSKGFW